MMDWLLDSPRRYISIDGGTLTAGACYFSIEDGKMVVHETTLFDVRRDDPAYRYIQIRHGELTARLVRLQDQLSDWVVDLPHPPLILVYESHFINTRRPTSVIPLVRFMQAVDHVMVANGIRTEYIAPQEMKKAIRVTGRLAKADKDIVKRAIQGLIDEGEIESEIDLNEISEHEIDAIGIGYAGMLKYYLR